VRIQSIFRGPKKKQILLYYGQVKELGWDPARPQRPQNKEFMHYKTWQGAIIKVTTSFNVGNQYMAQHFLGIAQIHIELGMESRMNKN
jgi:hypothetical protein